MIDKDWRRRLKTLSERLDCLTPSLECQFALDKFKELKHPTEKDQMFEDNSSYIQPRELDVHDLTTQAIDKVLDMGILADILLRKK